MSEHTEGAPSAPGGLRARVKRLTEWALSTKPVRAFLLYQEQHGAMLADSVTYRTLFSVFAGTFLGFAIAGIWLAGNPEAIDAIIRPPLIGRVAKPDSVGVRPVTICR